MKKRRYKRRLSSQTSPQGEPSSSTFKATKAHLIKELADMNRRLMGLLEKTIQPQLPLYAQPAPTSVEGPGFSIGAIPASQSTAPTSPAQLPTYNLPHGNIRTTDGRELEPVPLEELLTSIRSTKGTPYHA